MRSPMLRFRPPPRYAEPMPEQNPLQQIHAIVRADIAEAADFYLKDLQALPETDLFADRGARLAIDFTYETVEINRRMAARLRGQEPKKLAREMPEAPDLFRDKTMALDEIRDSANELLAAWDELGPDRMTAMVRTSGEDESALSLALFAARHMQHHDGQLTYLQSLSGDRTNHWAD